MRRLDLPAFLRLRDLSPAHRGGNGNAAAATLAATGRLALAGAATVALRPATLSATGTLQPLARGTAAVTLRPATLDAAGQLTLAGVASVTLRPSQVVATGRLALTGTASVMLRAATLAASGIVREHAQGTAMITLRPATLAASGLILRGRIGERHRLLGARLALTALGGTRRAPVVLNGQSDMTQVL